MRTRRRLIPNTATLAVPEAAPQQPSRPALVVPIPERPARRPSKKSGYLKPYDAALLDAEQRAEQSGEWAGAPARTFIGLYIWCHRRCYGVEPEELKDAAMFRRAEAKVGALLRDSFEQDGEEYAVFIQWSWMEEQRKVKWAEDKGVDRGGKRLIWQFLFCSNNVTNYKVAKQQAQTRRGHG